ncbi:MAG: hypothetical protein JRE43_04350 [Deltaproteobacteria bacterium]|nr:hypothetical protein [Deltaproteobacteria bacterium]
MNHWELTPFEGFTDLVMEPAISLTLHTDLDITPGLLEDVGHRLIHVFSNGFEPEEPSTWSLWVP